MMKTQIGLGVLSIPLVFDTLGMIPGIIILLAIAIITTWVCESTRNDLGYGLTDTVLGSPITSLVSSRSTILRYMASTMSAR